MSDTSLGSRQSASLDNAESDTVSAHEIGRSSFIERFLSGFFHEKNIKWMLVVGAAIVFGSSLMLVTKAWPNWSPVLKYLTILGYTAAIFVTAEVGRVRLGLTVTGKVLHSLTLLLLPVCFLALAWLSPGVATQSFWQPLQFVGLLIPACTFLWLAAGRILDHQLRERQTTFLVSYCVLCVAGALPRLSSPTLAFFFMCASWCVFTAGTIKVNRHTFWLAEEYRLPRVFGFLPVAILGLQFLVLTGTKAAQAIPVQWIGFGCVMLAATVLQTTRTVADVFRQRTGNLVRPLPWNIVIPMFSGLVLTTLGLFLSFRDFSYLGETTYAVIPTACVAAGLMLLAARDTRHAGFVWAGLICLTVAYQCAPVLFADVVQTLKQSTAEAINRSRVPVSLYGITYLPLLGTVAAAYRWLAARGEEALGRPLKHFVTIVALLLFAVAIVQSPADIMPLFLVATIYVGAFFGFAVVFRDRRYTSVSLAALVISVAAAPAALHSMGYAPPITEWTLTILSGLAVLLTLTRIPDRILNTIPLPERLTLRHRDPQSGGLTNYSLLWQTVDGKDRGLAQLTGCVLATALAAQWTIAAGLDFTAPLSHAALAQFGLLITAMFVYTFRNPQYLSGLCLWSMIAFAAFRWGAGQPWTLVEALNLTSFGGIGITLGGYSFLRRRGLMPVGRPWTKVAKTAFATPPSHHAPAASTSNSGGWIRQTQAFVVPLCDLSLVILSCLVAPVHLALIAKTHLMVLADPSMAVGSLLASTSATVWWLAAVACILRSRTAGAIATIAVPIWVTAMIASMQLPLPAAWYPVVWAALHAINYALMGNIIKQPKASHPANSMSTISSLCLQGLMVLSCLSFELPFRLTAGLCLAALLYRDLSKLTASRTTWFAIVANVQVLLLVAALGGCSGFILSPLAGHTGLATVPLLFITSVLSAVFFDRGHKYLDPVICRVWSGLVKNGVIVLAAMSLAANTYPPALILIMAAGFVIAAVETAMQAVRHQNQRRAWLTCGIAGVLALFLMQHEVIRIGSGISQFVFLGVAAASLTVAAMSTRHQRLACFQNPLTTIGQTLPGVVTVLSIAREFRVAADANTAMNALALMIAAGIWFQQAITTRRKRFTLLSLGTVNISLMLLWRSLQWHELEFYLVPLGLSVLGFVELLKAELPAKSHDPLRYIGALTILVSPVFDVLGGSWAHMFTLMLLSVVMILIAIGLRVRALVYAGSAFLLADLTAMVIRSTVDHPTLLWVGGVVLGAAVIALAAVCENHREKVLAKIRLVTAELATWN